GCVLLHLAWRRIIAPSNPTKHFTDVPAFNWRPAGQDTVKRGSKTVDVAAGPKLIEAALGLLRTHVGHGADDLSLFRESGRTQRKRRRLRRLPCSRPARPGCLFAECFSQAPIDHQRLAISAQHNVGRFYVPVDATPA